MNMTKDEAKALHVELQKAMTSLNQYKSIDTTILDGIKRRNKIEGTWDEK